MSLRAPCAALRNHLGRGGFGCQRRGVCASCCLLLHLRGTWCRAWMGAQHSTCLHCGRALPHSTRSTQRHTASPVTQRMPALRQRLHAWATPSSPLTPLFLHAQGQKLSLPSKSCTQGTHIHPCTPIPAPPSLLSHSCTPKDMLLSACSCCTRCTAHSTKPVQSSLESWLLHAAAPLVSSLPW